MMYWIHLATVMTGYAACTASARSTRKRDTSATSLKITQLFPLTPVTAETYFSVKNALHFVLLPTSERMKAGWQSICLFSVSKIRRAKLNMLQQLSRLLVEKPILLCLFHRNLTARMATRFGLSATTLLGCAKVLTADFML